MTKAELKRRRDKLLVAKNMLVSQLRLGRMSDETRLALTSKFSLPDVATASDIIRELNKEYEQQCANLAQPEKPEGTTEPTPKPTQAESTSQATITTAPSQQPVAETHRRRSDNATDVAPRWLAPERKRVASLRIWQRDASDWLLDRIMTPSQDPAKPVVYPMSFLRSGTGTGKTYMIADVVQQLWDSGWVAKQRPTMVPFLIVTKAPVVEQFTRDLKYKFGIEPTKEFMVTNYEQLRSGFGARYIKTTERLNSEGEMEVIYEWHPFMNPLVVVWDEAHSLKNEGSTQHTIAMALQHLPSMSKSWQISMSATPWTRIADCKHFATTARLEV